MSSNRNWMDKYNEWNEKIDSGEWKVYDIINEDDRNFLFSAIEKEFLPLKASVSVKTLGLYIILYVDLSSGDSYGIPFLDSTFCDGDVIQIKERFLNEIKLKHGENYDEWYSYATQQNLEG